MTQKVQVVTIASQAEKKKHLKALNQTKHLKALNQTKSVDAVSVEYKLAT